jgi:hypothetical protein
MTYLQSLEVQEHVVELLKAVRVCVCTLAATLKILPTHEACIHVDVRERNRAEFLEIKVQNCPAVGEELKGKATHTCL